MDPRLKQGVQQKKSKKALLTFKRSNDGPAMSSTRTGVGAGGLVAAVGALAGGSGAASAALPGGSGAASAALPGGSGVASDAADGNSGGDIFWAGTSGGDPE
ncbi:unnamed protein product [Urochloa humidicola]